MTTSPPLTGTIISFSGVPPFTLAAVKDKSVNAPKLSPNRKSKYPAKKNSKLY